MTRIHRSITVLASTLIGAVTTVMLLCAVALLIRLGGDDDGTWGALKVTDILTAAVARNEQGSLIIKPTKKLVQIKRNFPAFWYVVSDKNSSQSYGPVPRWLPSKITEVRDGAGFVAYSIDGGTRTLKRSAASRETAAGPVLIEMGGVAYTATQLMVGTLTDATYVSIPILLVLGITGLVAMIIVPTLIARPVYQVATAAEVIDGVPGGRRLPEHNAPLELLPMVLAFNRALDRIDTASSAQRQFLLNAAHELRTPLTRLRTQLERVPDVVLRSVLSNEIQELSSTVTMLLQLARISVEPTEFTRLDLVSLARTVAAEHVPMALHRGSEIAFLEPDHSIWIKGCVGAINVALSNVVRNAISHGQSSEPIIIQLAEPARLIVIDHGRGIDIGRFNNLFKPLVRGKTNSEGTGLGLSIVSQVMAMHKGGVTVSETPGGGTTFELSFPTGE